MERINCNLCGADKTERVCSSKDRMSDSEVFSVVRCLGCGLLYTNPRPSKDEMGRYYPAEYSAYQVAMPLELFPEETSLRIKIKNGYRRRMLALYYGYFGGCRLPEPICAVLRFLFLPLRYRIGSTFPMKVEGGKALDVGSGPGRYLSWLRELGWKVQGVEFDEKTALAVKEKLGLKIIPGDFEAVPLNDDSFDAVTAWHSLEHMRNPQGVLRKIFAVLKGGGRVMIEVPNNASLEAWLVGKYWWAWDVPRHLYHFTPRTITAMLEKAGFKEIRIEHLPALKNVMSLWNVLSGMGILKKGSSESFFDIGRNRLLGVVLAPFGWLQALTRSSGSMVVYARK